MPITINRSHRSQVTLHGAVSVLPDRPVVIDPRSIGLPPKFTRLYPQQEDTILTALASPRRFIGIFAPTASGKTAIYHAIHLLYGGRAQINVHTKYLQEQITNDFPDTFSIMGHRNYCPITVSASDPDAEDGMCPLGKRCLYKPEVERAADSDIIVTNYAHDLTIKRSFDPDRLGYRSLLILDEAHGIHNEICQHMACVLTYQRVQRLLGLRFPSSARLADWIEWAREAISVCAEHISELEDEQDRGFDDGTITKEINKLTRLSRNLQTVLDTHESVPYVVKPKDDGTGTQLIPVLAKPFAESALFRGVPKVILTSASIDKLDLFDLGISADDLEYIEMPSVIPVARRRIYFTPTNPPTSLKWPTPPGVVRLHAKLVDEIISARLDRRGLIHTQSYDLNTAILEEMSSRDLVITHTSRQARTAVERFRVTPPPTVLASPAVSEGYDFPYELCSYGIILKLPWPNVHGNPELQERCRIDKTYRSRYVVQKMEQAIGRTVRTPTDIGEIFITDEQWGWFTNPLNANLHQYVREALVDCSGRGRVLPTPPRLDYGPGSK